jgi:hypothetical protein
VGAHASDLSNARRRLPLWRHPALVLPVLAVICAVFLAGFLVGKHQSSVTVLTGRASVGDGQATVRVNGWSYDVDGSVQFWIDPAGNWHAGGWPSCLRLGQRPTITFGEVPASLPDGVSFKQVVWVDCRG